MIKNMMNIKKKYNSLSRIILELPRYAKRIIVMIVDITMCLFSIWIAFFLRLEVFFPLEKINNLLIYISIGSIIPIFWLTGLYQTIFRYSDKSTIAQISLSILIYSLICVSIFTIYTIPGVPRSIGILQPLILFFLIYASRLIIHSLYEIVSQINNKASNLSRALIYGAGSAGRQLVLALDNSFDISAVGFIDDNHLLHGQTILGKKIYSSENIELIIKTKKISHILLALPSVNRSKRMQIIKKLNKLKIIVRTLPSVSDLIEGKVAVSDIRELEIDDLLAREQVLPDEDLLKKNINSKTVLVTGAGGSIGSQLCKEILKQNPLKLILLEVSEYALYKINQELIELNEKLNFSLKSEIIPLLASIQNKKKLNDIFSIFKPHTVYHAAAYKHVPLVEENIAEGLQNNVYGTLFTAEVSLKNKVLNFVLISSDKAVRPTNIMGASKRLSELCLQALNTKYKKSETKFCMVRFGNVLASSGSVIPKFKKQIKDGGPITLTHNDVTRYFMTLSEASQLVIQASAMSKGGDVFILDMGKPIKIRDLIIKMLNLSGLSLKDENNLDGDIEVKIVGLRPGEKLYEELMLGDKPQTTEHPKIFRSQDTFIPWGQFQIDLQELNLSIENGNIEETINLIKKLIQGYAWNGKIVDHLKKNQF